MKRTTKLLMYFAAAAMTLASCGKEEIKPAEPETPGVIKVRFGAEAPITKAVATDDDLNFESTWIDGDEIGVTSYLGGSSTESNLEATWIDDAFYADFDGNKYISGQEYQFKGVYPYSNDGSVDFGATREQTLGNQNGKYDIMVSSTISSVLPAENKLVLPMERQTATVYFHLKSELDEVVKSATLITEDGKWIAASTATLNHNGFSAPGDEYQIKLNILEQGANKMSTKDMQFWFNVLPVSETSLTLLVETETHSFTMSKKNKNTNWEAGHLYTTVIKDIPAEKWAEIERPAGETTETITMVSDNTSEYKSESNNITAKFAKAGANNAPAWNASESAVRVYAKGTLTVSSEYTITKIVYEAKLNGGGQNNNNYPTPTTDKESFDANTWTWEGAANSVVLTPDGTAGNIAVSSITVSYVDPNAGTDPIYKYSVMVDKNVTNGTIGIDKTSAKAGDIVTLTPQPADGYELVANSLKAINAVSGAELTVTDNKFTMPAANVNVTAAFVFNYKLSVTPVNPENVSSEATTKHFTVTTNTSDWEAVVDPAHTWASINNKTATGFDVVLTANELPAESTLDRLVTVYITSEQAGYTGEKKITRTFTQAGKTYVDPDSDITFNFTEENPGDWRTTQGDGTYTYTLNDVDYSFTIGNGRYTEPSGKYSGYVMLYSTSTSGSYLSLPTREGKKLTKVVIKSRSGGSTAVAVGISVSPDASVSVTGGTAQTWSSAGSEYTYNLSNTEAEEVYYITNYSEKNAQIESITLSFENEAPKVVDHLALSGTYPTVFYVGDTYNRTGMIVTAFFTDNTNKNVTDLCSFNGFNSASPVASQPITVGYKTSEISYNVTIKALLSITNYASAEGNVTASKNTAKPGETIALIVSPADGKKLTSNSLKVHKTGDENTTVSVVDNSFTMPDYDVTIKAAFEAGSPGFTTKKTVTYKGAAKQSDKWQVNTTGSAPIGSSATYDQSYRTLGQMTKGNWVKYTITGFTGKKITKISLSMKSNTKGGAGWYYFKSGTNTLSSIGSDGSGVAFNQSKWNNAWSTSYVTVTPTMSDATHVVAQGENLEVYIKATDNSLYCQSIEIEYYE